MITIVDLGCQTYRYYIMCYKGKIFEYNINFF